MAASTEGANSNMTKKERKWAVLIETYTQTPYAAAKKAANRSLRELYGPKTLELIYMYKAEFFIDILWYLCILDNSSYLYWIPEELFYAILVQFPFVSFCF